ncbi:MAG: ABC transporter ATP-binding protein [Roseiflexus sp.]|nr:ABC transporter ATP-binding protein [Roseiflexus sp.]MDW8147947.1 ABC transporter ATP-binding protein [Roseiflexaceae bacterium]
MSELAIDVRNVRMHYGTGQRRIEALKGVSLDVRRGEIFGLLGPNGAGKTTLLSCIEGLYRPDTGAIFVAGIDVLRDPQHARRKLGIQLQSTALIDGLTALELIEVYAALYEVYLSRSQILDLLERFGLIDQAHRRAKQMSGGQRQRLALAIALSTDPEIVLLDEPTGALDPAARREVWRMIRALKDQGRTIVITTHSIDEAEALCGRVAIIDEGRIVACDSPHRLIAANVQPVLKATVELPLEALPSLPGATQMRYVGEHLEIETVSPEATLQALYAAAQQHGRLVRDIAVRQPNLEDVYLKLTGRRLEPSA